MDVFIAHLRENPVGYGVVLAFLVPLLYIGRKYTAPVIFHGFEVVLYSALFHLAFCGAVRFLAWFKGASEFRQVDTAGAVQIKDFTTPLTNFWMRDQYVPVGLFYFECLAIFVILCIVVYYRPMSLGKNYYKGKDNRSRVGKRPKYAAGNGRRRPKQVGGLVATRRR